MKSLDPTNATSVVIRCIDSDTVVHLRDRWRLDQDSIHYAVEASAPPTDAVTICDSGTVS